MTEVLEVICPICGGLIESDKERDLIRLAKLHTRYAHNYEVPAEHVLKASTRPN